MLFLRLLIFFLLAYIIYRIVRAILRQKLDSLRHRSSVSDGEEMVLDPQCRCYVPKRSAYTQQGRYFCSPECAKLYLSR